MLEAPGPIGYILGVNLTLHTKVYQRPPRRGFYFELLCWGLSDRDASHPLRSPTRHALTPVCNLMGAGACPALTIRYHVLRDTGMRHGLCVCPLPPELLALPMISFSRTSAESGRVSKNDRSACNIVFPHDAS